MEIVLTYCGDCPCAAEECKLAEETVGINPMYSIDSAKRHPECPIDLVGGKITLVLDKSVFPENTPKANNEEEQLIQDARKDEIKKAILAGLKERNNV
jgi:hypothetical protein